MIEYVIVDARPSDASGHGRRGFSGCRGRNLGVCCDLVSVVAEKFDETIKLGKRGGGDRVLYEGLIEGASVDFWKSAYAIFE